jgi:hypothetical protein
MMESFGICDQTNCVLKQKQQILYASTYLVIAKAVSALITVNNSCVVSTANASLPHCSLEDCIIARFFSPCCYNLLFAPTFIFHQLAGAFLSREDGVLLPQTI